MKNEIRKKNLAIRKKLPKEFIINASMSIAELFFKHPLSSQQILMSYISHHNEVDLSVINNTFDTVAIPYITDDDIMVACELGKLEIGKYGILVPKKKIIIDKNTITLCLIPGIAFDRSGNRVGYGKAYYDQFLVGMNCIKIACCYEWQIVDAIPKDPHDITMDYILTEKEIYRVTS